MKFTCIKSALLLLVCFCLSSISAEDLLAQTSTLSADEQFKDARNAAFEENDYEKARKLAYSALQKSPDYHDIRIFIANLYGWEGRYGNARDELEFVLLKDPTNRIALVTKIDIESKAGNYSEALRWASKAKQHFPGDTKILMQEASAYYNLEKYPEAERLYKIILSDDPSHTGASLALETVMLKQLKHTMSLNYRYDRLNRNFDPWNFLEFALSRQTILGSVVGRVQYANRFASNGVQFNIDAYPSIYSGLYAYISAGYSDSPVYPDTRLGLSLYKSLPWAMEVEGGIRYLKFSSAETMIYTFSLSKYWGSYLFTGRTYIIPFSGDISQSYNILARRYFGDTNTYFEISGSFGSAPSEVRFSEDLNSMKSRSLTAEIQYPLTNRFLIGGSGSFFSEEFTNNTRDRFTLRSYLSYRF